MKKSFHWFNTKNTVEWFEERNIKLKTEADGRMFPATNDSQTIIDCLLKEATKYNIELLLNCEVKEIKNNNGLFQLTTSNSQLLTYKFLC